MIKLSDPCKEGKCISYPICLNSKTKAFTCDDFIEFIDKTIAEMIHKRNLIPNRKFKPLRHKHYRELDVRLNKIFPHLYVVMDKSCIHYAIGYQREIYKAHIGEPQWI